MLAQQQPGLVITQVGGPHSAQHACQPGRQI